MTGAFLYLVACSIRNRLTRQLRRLREPRYLAGAVVGGLYFYFAILRPQFRRSGRAVPRGAADLFQRFGGVLTSVGALALWIIVLLRWIVPTSRQPLAFSGAEVQFLFTGPVTRRQILQYKLLRGQIGVFFGSLIALLFAGTAAAGSRASFLLGVFVLLATLRLHLLAVALCRASLLEPGGRRRWRTWLPLAVTGAASAALVAGLALPLGPLVRAWPAGVGGEILRRADQGLAAVVLWPLRALVLPILAPWPGGFVRAVGPALALLGLNYAWVLASDARLEQAAVASERQRTESGRPRAAAVTARRAPFALGDAGRPEVAILWKNLVMLGRYANVRNLLRFAAPLAIFAVVVTSGRRGGAELVALVAAFLAASAALLGPQMARNDLRTDLAKLAILKSWPLSGASIVAGEILAPLAILSVAAWVGLIVALVSSLRLPLGGLSGLDRLALTVSAMIVVPSIALLQLVIQNGAAVLFPGWVIIGQARSRGIETMGQQMLLFAATILLLALGVLPAAAVGALIAFVLHWIVGWIGLVPAAAVFGGVLVAEAWLAVQALGRVLDRTDPAAVEAGE